MTADTANTPLKLRRIARIALTIVATITFGAATFYGIQYGQTNTDLSLLSLSLVLSFAYIGGRIAWELIDVNPSKYNAAEVTVKGPIKRDVKATLGKKKRMDADDIVDQIENANDDSDVDGLLLNINTPGGEIVPSEDIRLAVEKFDGPVVGYATDICASGGYLIASACDAIVARKGSMVGSIGVIGSRQNFSEAADKLGINYEQFTAGDYKDAGTPWKDMEDDERDYIQNLIDTHYDEFVETVAQGRDMTELEVRNTEAKVFLGRDALENGLVDVLDTEDGARDLLREFMQEANISLRTFENDTSFFGSLNIGVETLAYAFGSGIGDKITPQEDTSLSFEYRQK